MPFGVPSVYQVIKYLVIDFEGKFLRSWLIQGCMYTASVDASILVVTDDETGNTVTYVFKVPAGEEIWVDRNLVHIPAHCVKQVKGNAVKCP
jgi:hypothetical protein